MEVQIHVVWVCVLGREKLFLHGSESWSVTLLIVGRPYLLNVLKNKGQYGSTDTRGLGMCVRHRETVFAWK